MINGRKWHISLLVYSSKDIFIYVFIFESIFIGGYPHLLELASSYEKSAFVGWIVWACGSLGSMHLDLGEYDDAVNCYKKIISTSENAVFCLQQLNFSIQAWRELKY